MTKMMAKEFLAITAVETLELLLSQSTKNYVKIRKKEKHLIQKKCGRQMVLINLKQNKNIISRMVPKRKSLSLLQQEVKSRNGNSSQ
jgi:hypothetical protein